MAGTGPAMTRWERPRRRSFALTPMVPMPAITADFATDSAGFSQFWRACQQRLDALPPRPQRNPAETDAAATIHHEAREARERFLAQHVEKLYAAMTGGLARFLRVEDLVLAAAEAVPGLVPDR